MVRRSSEAWRELIAAQVRSGMTVAAFCREHGLSQNYFSLRKKRLRRSTQACAQSPFVRIEPMLAGPVGPHARLQLGRCEWELSGFTLDDLTRLMVALA